MQADSRDARLHASSAVRGRSWTRFHAAAAFLAVTTVVAAAQGRTGGGPSNADLLARVQQALFSGTADIPGCIRDLKAVLAADPQSHAAHVLLGIAYRGLGTQEFIAEAVAEFRQALEIDPTDVAARLYLAHGYRELGRLDRAREELAIALTQAPGNPQLLALLGDTERQLRNPARALELEDRALASTPGDPQARYYRGLALLDVGRRNEGIRELEQVIAAGVPVADAYLALGTAYLDAGRIREGVDVLTRGADIDPARADVRVRLARAQRMNGALAQADAELARVAKAPTGARLEAQRLEFDVALERGLLRLAEGQLAAAAEALRLALTMEPDHGEANRGLAQVYLRQGNYALAAQHAARAEKAGAPLTDAERALLRQKGGGHPGTS
jgi:tetratricopeptide (TPR) repeat protein